MGTNSKEMLGSTIQASDSYRDLGDVISVDDVGAAAWIVKSAEKSHPNTTNAGLYIVNRSAWQQVCEVGIGLVPASHTNTAHRLYCATLKHCLISSTDDYIYFNRLLHGKIRPRKGRSTLKQVMISSSRSPILPLASHESSSSWQI